MRHRLPRHGVASPNQLLLFDDVLQHDWCGGAAGPAEGRSPGSSCQGVIAISALVALLYRAERALVSGPVPLHVAQQLAVDALRTGLAGNEDTVKDTITCVIAFFRYATHHGALSLDDLDEPMVEAFIQRATHRAGVYTDPADATLRNRRWQVGELFDTLRRLQLWHGPVLFGEPVPSRTGKATRPLTARELHQVRVHSYHWMMPSRRPIVIALAEAGGSAAEIAAVELTDLDLDAGTVAFRGEAARTNRFPAEALTELRSALTEGAAVGSRRLVVGDSLDVNKAKRSVTQELSETIRDAGLSRTPRVSGRSIRLHHALTIFHAEGIGAAVRFLGAQSVDTTMRSLGLTVDDL